MSTDNKEKIQQYHYTNESFSGCDMVATILMPNNNGGNTVYAIGELQTVSYSIHMDRRPVRNIGNINVKDYVMGPRTIAGSLVFAVFNKHFANKIASDISKQYKPGYAFLIDELPPFDIVISMANEYGLRSKLVIYGVRLVNEGQVMSINDVYTENTYQFVATDLEYLNSETQYAGRSSGTNGLYTIIDNSVTKGLGSTLYPTKEAVKPIGFDIELRHKVRSIATKLNDGIVDLWLTPAKRNGIITISSTSEEMVLNVNVEDTINGNNRVSVKLPAGEYEAIWRHDNLSSNITYFKIEEDIIPEEEKAPAPLIEGIGDTFVKILCNYNGHTKVVYEDEEGNRFSVKLRGKRATLNGLEADKIYKIATCSEDLQHLSEIATVNTLPFGYDLYKDFIDYVSYNLRALQNSDSKVYIDVIYRAKTIAMSGIKYETLTDTLVEANKQFNDELSELDQINFPNMESYQKELDRITALLDASVELISIAVNLSNDEIYGYNYETLVVDPPVLGHVSGCTNTFLLNKNIQSVDFYRQFSTTAQFSKTIEKNNFNNNHSEYSVCTFNGRPETRHYVYAVNEHGYKSSRVDFFVYDDSYRSIAIEKARDDFERTEYELKKVDSEIGKYLDTELSSDDKKRVFTEAIKSNELKRTKAPVVIERTAHSITIKIIEDLDILKDIEARVVVGDIDYALMNTCRYKMPVEQTIEFNSRQHGIRPNKSYAIWIEDNDGYQISQCVTANTLYIDDLDQTSEYLVAKYFIDEATESIENEFKNSNVNSKTLDNIIYKNRNDIEANKIEVCDKILEDIIEDYSNIDNMFDVLYAYFKSVQNTTYDINENFFIDSPTLLNKDLLIYEDCFVKIVNISQHGISKEQIKVNSGDTVNVINSSQSYTMIHFVKNDLSSRSGFMLINNFNGNSITNRLKVRIGEQHERTRK